MKSVIKYLQRVSEDYNVPLERLMCGVMNGDFYVWDYDSSKSQDKQFKVISINDKPIK
jgi:hypothetical protein